MYCFGLKLSRKVLRVWRHTKNFGGLKIYVYKYTVLDALKYVLLLVPRCFRLYSQGFLSQQT